MFNTLLLTNRVFLAGYLRLKTDAEQLKATARNILLLLPLISPYIK